MQTWEITVKIITLVGTHERVFNVKAQTENSAQKKAFAKLGNQSFDDLKIKKIG